MDRDFKNLAPCDPSPSLEDVKKDRQQLLYSFFEEFRPDIFLVELYPFGRKAFRFELDPVLAAIRDGSLPPCKCYVSLRDILVERPDDRETFEKRVVKTLNGYFDGLLIHSDSSIITLDETFGRVHEINIPIAYTGFVTRPATGGTSRGELRRRLRIKDTDKLIVVSIGGGNVGDNLLTAAIEAFRLFDVSSGYHMQLFSGPYCRQEVFERLRQDLPAAATLDRFSDSFPDWLQAADLSLSMAGYNTCMNIIQAGVPALLYPFAQNREQEFRASRLQKRATLRILTENDLQQESLSAAMREMSHKSRYPVGINLSGAEGSLQQLELWHNTI
jgi:predicted glycosyltransferase